MRLTCKAQPINARALAKPRSLGNTKVSSLPAALRLSIRLITMSSDIREAFGKLKDSVSSEDAQDFQSTTLQDVRSAVHKIEQQQAQRQSLRNIRRIEPFLKFMETYSRVIEVSCQGFSPMAWVWVRLVSLGVTTITADEQHPGTTQAYAPGEYVEIVSSLANCKANDIE